MFKCCLRRETTRHAPLTASWAADNIPSINNRSEHEPHATAHNGPQDLRAPPATACVSLAYGDATRAGKEAEVVAVVVEGGTRTIQGTWIDGSSFDHTVAEL